jgi:hypothetical protein
MKKIISIALFAIILTSCSKKPEDACGCIEKAANDFMVQGVKIESIDDLRQPCIDLIDQFKDDAAARALIIERGTKVLESLKNKELIKIEGEELPVLPSYTFNTIGEFNTERFKDGGEYKFFRTHIAINEPVYIGNHDVQRRNTAFSSSNKKSQIYIALDSTLKNNPFYSGIIIDEFYLLVDTKTHNFVLDSSKLDIAAKTINLFNWNEGSISGISSSVNAFNEIEKVTGFNNFISDLKSGRYYRVGNFNQDGGDTKEFQKQAASLENVFGRTMCFSKAEGFSGVYEGKSITVDKINNITKLPPPNLELLNRTGEQLDIKPAIEQYLNRDKMTDYPGGSDYN